MLALTWEQLEVVTACVAEFRAYQLNVGLEVLATALGGSVDKPARRKGKRTSKRKPKADPAAQFAAAGITVSAE